MQVISQLTSLEVARASKETSISDLRGCYHSLNSQKYHHHRFTTYIAYKLESGVVVVVQACMHYVPKCVLLWSDFFLSGQKANKFQNRYEIMTSMNLNFRIHILVEEGH